MALRSALAAYIGWKEETTYGTGVTPDEFIPWIGQNLTEGINQEMIVSDGVIAGNRVMIDEQSEKGVLTVTGDFQIELHKTGIESLLKLMFGGVSTSGAGPYAHLYTMDDLPSATLGIGVPENDTGTIRDFRFTGAKVASWEMSVNVREYARLGITWICQGVTTETALTPSFPASLSKFKFDEADYQRAATSECAESVTIRGDNGLELDKACLNQNTIDEPYQINPRTYEMEAALRFTNLNNYNDYIAKTVVNYDLDFTSGTDLLTFNMRGKVEPPGGPSMSGPGPVTQTVKASLLGDGSTDDSAITVTLTNDTVSVP